MATTKEEKLAVAWRKTATRGELLKAIVNQRAINLKLIKIMLAMEDGDKDGVKGAFDAFFEADADNDKLVNELSEADLNG